MRSFLWGAIALAVACAAPGLVFAQSVDPAFATCSICHSLTEGKNGIGPSLHGVFGAKKASVAGFAYSPALKAKGGLWTAAALDAYLTDPSKDVPGTKMVFSGQKDPAKRAATIALLKMAR